MRLRAYVCEARPLCEGVALAEAWEAAGVHCTLITDAQVGLQLALALHRSRTWCHATAN